MPDTPTPPAPKRRLGRGLSSLIANSAPPPAKAADYQPSQAAEPGKAALAVPEAGADELSPDQIAPNPYQPRRDFDAAEIDALAESIANQGLLQPLLVVPSEDPAAAPPYVLVAGERRLRAARQAGLATVPCLVRSASRQQMLEWALIENIHRKDLDPVERATAYREYMDRFNLTQVEAAQRLGEPRATLANCLRVLDLPAEVQQMLVTAELTFGHAKVLAGLPTNPDRQIALARRCRQRSLSVRQLEGLIAAELADSGADPRPASRARPRAAYLCDFEDQLLRAIGTRVQIRPGRAKNPGRIVIDDYNLDDFDRIVASLGAHLES